MSYRATPVPFSVGTDVICICTVCGCCDSLGGVGGRIERHNEVEDSGT